MKHMRVLFTTVIVLFMMVVSGCVKTETGTTIHTDGSITNRINMQLLPVMAKLNLKGFSQDIEQEFQKRGYVTHRIENGVEGSKNYSSIQEAVASGEAIFNPPNRFGGVRYKSGWLYDVYDLDLSIKADFDSQTDAYAKEIIDQMEVTYHLDIPNAVLTTNADTVSKDRRSLTWDIKKAYTRGEGVPIKATFKVYHPMGIAMFVGTIIVLFVVSIILLVQIKNKQNISETYIKKVRIFASVMMTVGAILFLFVFAKFLLPPHLSEQDKVTKESIRELKGSSWNLVKQIPEEKTPEEKTQIKLDEFAKRYKWKTLGKLLATSEHDDAGFAALVEQDGKKVIAVYSQELDELALIRNASPKTDVLKQFFIPSKYGAGSHKPYEPLGILLQRIGKHPKDITDTNVLLGGFEGTGFSANIVVLYGISTETKNIHKSGYYYGFIRHVSEYTLPKYEVRDKGNLLLLDVMLDHSESLYEDAKHKGVL